MDNVIDVKALKSTERPSLIHLAHIAEGSKRYHDMCSLMKAVVAQSPRLSLEERNLLSIAYKNVVGAHREAWRSICNELESPMADAVKARVEDYKKNVEAQLHAACKEILDMVETKILPECPAEHVEARVFFLKMAGDYYRYIAETGESKGDKAVDYYKQSFELAKGLAKTHPTRLGLVLNYSVCIYEIAKDSNEACRLAKKAFDEAYGELESVSEEDYKDSTLIMQLLRDNLTVWMGESGDHPMVDAEDGGSDGKSNEPVVDSAKAAAAAA